MVHSNNNYRRFRSEGVEEGKLISIEQYLKKVRRHVYKVMKKLRNTGDSWKFNLNIVPEFIIKTTGEKSDLMPLWSSNQVIMEGSDLHEMIDDMYQVILKRYELTSEKLRKSDFIFHRITEMTYHCHKVDIVRGSSYIDLPEWVKKKHCCINPKNENDDECFKWAIIAAIHHKEIRKDSQRTSKLEPYSDRYNWTGIKFPTPINQCRKFERQNPSIALNVLYIEAEKRIKQAYISKFNLVREKIVDLLIIREGVKKHYVAITKLSALFRGITSSNNGDYYCRNCLHSFRTKKKCDLHIKSCKDNDFCEVKMPKGGEKFIQYIDGQKSLKNPFVIYADTECVLKPINGCDGDPNKPYTRDVNKHVASGYGHCLLNLLMVNWIKLQINIVMKIVWKSFVSH